MPAVEVHLSDVDTREEWERHSVVAELVVARISERDRTATARRSSCSPASLESSPQAA